MPNYIEPAVIDVNPITLKPILFTTYNPVIKYNIEITYEDSTTKTVELVQGDKNRPYKVVFKKEGRLITATGVPTIREVSESCKFCDFTNRVMDSNDLLIELDCSGTYECTKVRFYLKDIRDIVDLANENNDDDDDTKVPGETPITRYPIYLNGLQCTTKIYCRVDEDFNIDLTSLVTKIGEPLHRYQYSDFTVFTVDDNIEVVTPVTQETEFGESFKLIVSEELLNKEIKLIIKYHIYEIEHPVFDEFTIIPFKDKPEPDNKKTLSRAVSTADTQYLGDGLKSALGVGLTPGYKQYRNSKKYTGSVLSDEK